jgi:hypothetical protein
MLGQPAAYSSRRTVVGNPRWAIMSRVRLRSSSRATSTSVSTLGPSALGIVDLEIKRRGGSTPGAGSSRDLARFPPTRTRSSSVPDPQIACRVHHLLGRVAVQLLLGVGVGEGIEDDLGAASKTCSNRRL